MTDPAPGLASEATTDTEEYAQRLQALEEAHRRTCGGGLPEQDARWLADAGWDPTVFDAARAAAEHAAVSATYLAQNYHSRARTPGICMAPIAEWITLTLIQDAYQRWHADPDTAATTRAWLPVLAAARDKHTYDITALTVGCTDRHAYCVAAGHRLGPWAWAAGLSLTEARAQHDTGTLTTDGLWLLASMRGYIPPTT